MILTSKNKLCKTVYDILKTKMLNKFHVNGKIKILILIKNDKLKIKNKY